MMCPCAAREPQEFISFLNAIEQECLALRGRYWGAISGPETFSPPLEHFRDRLNHSSLSGCYVQG